jgi:hypothetical protein
MKISFQILKDTTKFRLFEPMLASLEGLLSMALVIFGVWWSVFCILKLHTK